MVKDELGKRMKENYEMRSRTYLTRRTPVIIRLDGCHFHTFTKGFKKPFDELFSQAMQNTMKYLCENIQGVKLGYTQSDEISLLLVDYETLEIDAWYDNQVQKMCSVAASMATLEFNKQFHQLYYGKYANPFEYDSFDVAYEKALKMGAIFDARAFNIPKEEVANYFYWRQADAERNSINSLAQTLYSQKQLQGISRKDLMNKVKEEKGIDWNELPITQQRGSCCIYDCLGLKDILDNETLKQFHEGKILCPSLEGVKKVGWKIDDNIPRFVDDDREYIEKLV